MKKYLVVVLALSLVMVGAVGVSFAVNPSGPGYSGDIMGMNTGRYASDPHRTFRLVRYQVSAATDGNLSAGQVVIWDTTATPTAADGVTITTTTTSGDARVAGVLVTAILSRDNGSASSTWSGLHAASEDVGLKNWGYVQTYGLTPTGPTFDGAAPVGSLVSASTTAGRASVFYHSTSSSLSPMGFANVAATDATASKVFLRCE